MIISSEPNIFGRPPSEVVTDLIAQRALSIGELQQRQIDQCALAQNYRERHGPDSLAMINYRPPVHVPQGWQDWYACGDQLQ